MENSLKDFMNEFNVRKERVCEIQEKTKEAYEKIISSILNLCKEIL
ncbi:UNVERIFIED_CONTAM: hypothetical protein Cloal_1164 [Acetivibrio alkalicellulosi]